MPPAASSMRSTQGMVVALAATSLFISLITLSMTRTMHSAAVAPVVHSKSASGLVGNGAAAQPAVVSSLGYCPSAVPIAPQISTDHGYFGDRSALVMLYQEAILRNSSHSAVIIGANVGATESDFSWNLLIQGKQLKKLMIEPIPSLFKKLEVNILQSGMTKATLMNAAVGTTDNATIPMYCLSTFGEGEETYLVPKAGTQGNRMKCPYWFPQVCSFNKKRLYDHEYDTRRWFLGYLQSKELPNIDDVDKYIIESAIQTKTVLTMFKEFTNGDLSDITYVQIDTEGFDYHVMMQLPLESEPTFRPCLIAWELVVIPYEQTLELVKRLRGFGYVPYRDDQNMVMLRVR